MHKEKALNQEIVQVTEEKRVYKDKLDELENRLEDAVMDMQKIARMTAEREEAHKAKMVKRQQMQRFGSYDGEWFDGQRISEPVVGTGKSSDPDSIDSLSYGTS